MSRLRHELEDTNRDLIRSLAENRRMREHLNRILEGLPCGVLVTEADGTITIANPETRRLLGTLADAGLDALERIPVWMQEWLDDMRDGSVEREYRCGSGSLEWISIRRAQLAAAEGGSSIFILQDVSEAKRLEEAQQALRRRQALTEMSSLLAHEIRNPLGSLELFAELLAESELGESESGKNGGSGRSSCKPACARWRRRSITSSSFTASRSRNWRRPIWGCCSVRSASFCARWPIRRRCAWSWTTISPACRWRRTGTVWNRCCSTWR